MFAREAALVLLVELCSDAAPLLLTSLASQRS